MTRFKSKSGVYTLVREHFGPDRNAAIRREMMVLKPVTRFFLLWGSVASAKAPAS